ncbi:hypothetical protein DMI62_01375 [Escherichia coli]|nr:hypothetical protein [Escherichia coli]
MLENQINNNSQRVLQSQPGSEIPPGSKCCPTPTEGC